MTISEELKITKTLIACKVVVGSSKTSQVTSFLIDSLNKVGLDHSRLATACSDSASPSILGIRELQLLQGQQEFFYFILIACYAHLGNNGGKKLVFPGTKNAEGFDYIWWFVSKISSIFGYSKVAKEVWRELVTAGFLFVYFGFGLTK